MPATSLRLPGHYGIDSVQQHPETVPHITGCGQEAETRRPSSVRGPLQASLSLERQTMKLQQEFNFNTETDSK